jgi:fermentation-respiration switch protein FrsA (DUF1100 family)
MMLKFLIILVGVYLLVMAAAYLFQRRFTYFPTSLAPDETVLLPEDREMKEVKLPLGGDLEIHGVFHPPPEGGFTVLFLHGNAGNLTHRMPLFRAILKRRVGGLLIDYRGYGKSPGRPSEKGLYEDASASLDWLASRGIPTERVILFGKSLGTGVAVEMARNHAVAGLILESPYTSIPAVGQRHVPFLPIRLLMHDRFDSLAKSGEIRCPILAIWSRTDRIVPPDLSERLYEALPSPKTKFVLDNAGHNEIEAVGGEAYWRAWDAFLESLPKS